MSNMLDSALYYAEEMGWSVIPIIPGQKRPMVKWEPYQKQKASREQIIQWWKNEPRANIGIVTGEISGIFVVDIDSEEGQQNIDELIPDSIIVPTATTPRGGKHLYFKYPQGSNITIGAGKIPGSDFRGEGGYAVAPPSINGTGKPYKWIIRPDLANLSVADLPILYINKLLLNNNINNKLLNNNIYGGVTGNQNPASELLHSVTFNLNKGHRDETLFHVANCLIKGGASKADAASVLKILAKSCNPPFPTNEIVTKCNSAVDRAERKERNLAQEIYDYVAVTSGYFSVTSCYMVLQVVTKQDKTTARVALNRLKEKGIIEKHPTQDGIYRRVETNFDFITFDDNEDPEVEYPVKLPLGLNDLAEISQGNIILVAGEFNAGKTSFLLNVLKNNKNRLPIRYITSEMSKSEFKKRFASFCLPLSFWKQDADTEYVRKSFDFHAAIKPDALNIIDYMEFRDSDYTKGAEYLTKIHDALKTGIAIVAVQKKEGVRMPRSGDMIIEKPRLAISLSKYESSGEYQQGIAEILKCKMPKLGKVDGRKCRFELQKNGSLFNILNDWGYLRF